MSSAIACQVPLHVRSHCMSGAIAVRCHCMSGAIACQVPLHVRCHCMSGAIACQVPLHVRCHCCTIMAHLHDYHQWGEESVCRAGINVLSINVMSLGPLKSTRQDADIMTHCTCTCQLYAIAATVMS